MKKGIKKMMILFIGIVLLVLSFPLGGFAESAVQAEYYINPSVGSDSNSGNENAPFKTIQKAIEVVKQATKNMSGDIYVYLSDGRYEVLEPIIFDARTGGKNGYKVYYKALPGAKPIISGGKKISDWEIYDEENNIYRAPTDGLYSRQLIIDGKLGVRARSEGRYLTDGKADKGKIGITCTNYEMLSWRNPSDIECIFTDSFYCRRVMVDKIYETEDGLVQLGLSDVWKKPIRNSTWCLPLYIENVFELLDSEGEYYIDQKEKYVYYKPLAGQDMEKAETYMSFAEDLFKIGGYDYKSRTKNIVFDGLTFTETTWTKLTEDRGLYTAQNGLHMAPRVNQTIVEFEALLNPSALTISKSVGVDIINCDFKALGASAIKLIEGSENVNIIGNHIRDLGGGAMYIGNVSTYERDAEDTRVIPKNINVSNNYIHHTSYENKTASAVSIGFPYNMTLANNEIHDTPYSAVHIGWDWQDVHEKPFLNFVCKNNYIHDFIKGANMGDGGGIYCLGYTSAPLDNPNKIINNYIKDGFAYSVQAGSMLYLDLGASNYLVEGNVTDNLIGKKKWDVGPFYVADDNNTNNLLLNNYCTAAVDSYGSNTKKNIIYEGNEYYPTANWPKEAREIIRNSGLTKEYQYLNPRSKEFARLFTEDSINIDLGETYTVIPVATTEMCDELSLENVQEIKYELKDEGIVSIAEDGKITAMNSGKTELTTTVTINGITKSCVSSVSVGTGLAELRLVTKLPNKILVGETKALPEITGINYGGAEIDGKLKDVTFKSSDESILDVDSVKGITGKKAGEASLIYQGTFAGTTVTNEYKMKIVEYGDPSGLNYPSQSIESMLEFPENWYAAKGEKTAESNGITFADTGVTQYTLEKYEDAMFDFYLTMDKQASWPSIALRNQDTCTGIVETNAMYLISFSKVGIEFQRFNGVDRTTFFSDLLPGTRVGNTLPMILEAGKKYHIQVGTFTEEEGVRIILNIDGVNVINFLDEAEERIDNEGYFGFIINSATWNITTN